MAFELYDKIYEEVFNEIKIVVDEGRKEAMTSSTPQLKLNCYEKMCTSITNILHKIKE